MTTQPEDDLVERLADVAMRAVNRALLDLAPTIRNEIVSTVRGEFSGEQVYIPKALAAEQAKRNELMRIDRAAGMSVRAVARKHHIGKTRAAEILKGGR